MKYGIHSGPYHVWLDIGDTDPVIAAALITWLFRKFTDNPFRSRRR